MLFQKSFITILETITAPEKSNQGVQDLSKEINKTRIKVLRCLKLYSRPTVPYCLFKIRCVSFIFYRLELEIELGFMVFWSGVRI